MRRLPPITLLLFACSTQPTSPHAAVHLNAAASLSGTFSITFANDGGVLAGTFSGSPVFADAGARADVGVWPDARADAGFASDATSSADAQASIAGRYEPYAPTQDMAPPGAHLAQPVQVEPAVGAVYTDPTFGTSVRRLPAGMFNDYSQLQAWSPSGKYLLLAGVNGYTVLDAVTFAVVIPTGTIPDAALRWHPLRDQIVGVVGSGFGSFTVYSAVAWDVPSGAMHTLAASSFPFGGQSIIQEEISADGRYMAMLGYNAGGGDTLLIADLNAGKIPTAIPLASLCGGKTRDDIDFSKSLTTVTAIQWHADGGGRCNGLELYANTTGTFVRQLHTAHGHGDWGIDPSGLEFYLTESDGLTSIYNNNYTAIVVQWVDVAPLWAASAPRCHKLANGTTECEVREIGWYADEHDSCRAAGDYCLISASPAQASTFAARRAAIRTRTPAWKLRDLAKAARHGPAKRAVKRTAVAGALDPMSGEEWLVNIQTGEAWRLAWHRTDSCGYFEQARGSLSRDGRFAIWSSDWSQAGCSDASTSSFIVTVRP